MKKICGTDTGKPFKQAEVLADHENHTWDGVDFNEKNIKEISG
jgi:hypothetical protein